jgi:hypothetical protein
LVCHIFREEHRLRKFANRVLRKIGGIKRDNVTEQWKKLHNEQLSYLYSSPNRYYSGGEIKKNDGRGV